MRLDRFLAERGDLSSRTLAAKAVAAGRVRVNGEQATKPSRDVGPEDDVVLAAAGRAEDRWVSRAGHKLAGALDAFPDVRVAGRACLDAGASTGGFTQVLLERGAARVDAVDVGHDQLHPRIAADPRVRSREGTNVRYLDPADLDAPVDLVVGDLSFISLTLVIPALTACLRTGGQMVLMVKPQFEVGRSRLGKGGVVRDPRLQREAVDAVRSCAVENGLLVRGEEVSPLPGQDGNLEFFLWLQRPEQAPDFTPENASDQRESVEDA